MRALALFGVLAAAKAIVLASQPADVRVWHLPAYFAPDALVAAAAWCVDAILKRPRAGWVVYAAAVAYVAVNVPVTVVLGSPLTKAMLRATSGTLGDSIAYYLTWDNLARIAVVVIAGVALPFLFMWRPPSGGLVGPAKAGHHRFLIGSLILTLIVAGSLMAHRIDTGGRDRNAFTALLPIGLPIASASAHVPDWRASPLPEPGAREDLRRYAGTAKGMNVLMVILESTAARYLRPYGAAEDPAPTLTRLSERAMLFEHAYSVYPESIKGLFSTLCSRYPLFNEPGEAQALMPCTPLAGELKRAGYQTALFHSGRFAYLGMQEVLEDRGFDTLEDAGAIGGNIHSSFGVDEPAAVARVLQWIDSRDRHRPFFAAYLPIAGHHPYATPAPGPFDGDDVFAQYQNALHYGDQALGQLLDGLKARSLYDRTLVIVFGDHGEAFGQHPGNIGHTLFIHDENMRVPYVIAIPGVTNAPERVPSVASLLDTAPTVLDLVGLPGVPDYQGTSMLSPDPRMALFFTDYSMGWLGLRDGCWKYQLETGAGRSRLFDVCRDADERNDVADLEPHRVTAYKTRVERWARDALTRTSQ